MDLMIFPSIRFTNVAKKLDETELARQLSQLLPTGNRVNAHQVTIYRTEGSSITTAVVTGVNLPFREIKLSLGKQRLGGRDIVVSHDYNLIRDPDGEISDPLTGENKQLLDRLFMLPCHNLWSFLVYDLAQEIKNGNYSNKITMTNARGVRNFDMIDDAGRVLSFLNAAHERSYIFVEYCTLLEKLQALCLLNGNKAFVAEGHFTKCKIHRQSGLGRDGNIDVAKFELDKGYIPFDAFRPELVKVPKDSLHYRVCYKCDGRGKISLDGVTSCLKFYAGFCNVCDYDNGLSPLNQSHAVRFQNETFSRIVIERNELRHFGKKKKSAYNLIHTPLKLKYESAKEARNIMCPIVSHESWIGSKLFTLANEVVGDLVIPLRQIEVINPEEATPEKQVSLYYFVLQTPRTPIWCPDSLQLIDHFLIEVFWHDRRFEEHDYISEWRRVKIKGIDIVDKNYVLVVCNMKLPTLAVVRPDLHYLVKPFQPNYEYTALRDTMSRWVNYEKLPEFDLIKKMLMGTSTEFRKFPNRFNLLLERLNPEQQSAVRRCQRSGLTVIQGPPGTGKTHTAAVAALEFASTERGMIICVARTNEAADNICKGISKILIRHQGSTNKQDTDRYAEIKVVRMASIKRQYIYFRSHGRGDGTASDFRYLHEEVRDHPRFGNDEDLKTLFARIAERGMDDLTVRESTLLEDHIGAISREILSKIRILVTTVSCLTDGRIKSYLDKAKKPLINTIMIDEAGVITMPQAVPILVFPAKRFIFFGDQEQLPPLVFSFSAEAAGLTMSIMLYLKLAIARFDPSIWRTLLEQYRMNQSICDIVNEMTYRGELRYGPNIETRKYLPEVRLLRRRVHSAIPASISSDVVVFQHTHPEEMDKSASRSNFLEAKMVEKLATRLTQHGVCPQQIVILTPYDAQRTLLLKLLGRKENTKLIKVMNIDAFQGKESDIIILSFVRSNKENDIGFCKSHQRLNVLISRARHFEFFVGDMNMMFSQAEVNHHIERLQKQLADKPRAVL